MSIPDQIRALETLASIDATLRTLDEQLASEKTTVASLKGSIAECQERLQSNRATLTSIEKTRSELTTDARVMTQQLEHSREKLGRARNERETNAVTRELEELRKLVRDREDEVSKLTAQSEGIRMELERIEQEAAQYQTELASIEGDVNAKVGRLEQGRLEKSQERDVAVKAVPAQLYRRYETIRSKRGTGIAQTTDGTCRACHMALPPQLFHRLRREPMIEQCQSCNRIIYYVAVTVTAITP